MIAEVQVKEHLSTSDHNILVWHLKCETKIARSETKKFANHRADYKAMNEWLTKLDWKVILGGNEPSTDEVWERFVNIIPEAVDNFVPVSKKKGNVDLDDTKNNESTQKQDEDVGKIQGQQKLQRLH